MGIFTKVKHFFGLDKPMFLKTRSEINSIKEIKAINKEEELKGTFNRLYINGWTLEFIDKYNNIVLINSKGKVVPVTINGLQTDFIVTEKLRPLVDIENDYRNHKLYLANNVDDNILSYIDNLDEYYLQDRHVVHQELGKVLTLSEKRDLKEKEEIKELIREVQQEMKGDYE